MSVLGIIAEFNPLHSGHIHLIQEARRKHNFAATVCVMSGNFTQRGEMSVCNKWSRARMALHAGIDLVIEIPFCFAVRSAYFFARGGLQILHKLNLITHLAFGCENPDIDYLNSIADILQNESEDFQKKLKKHLKQGLNFPLARARALKEILPHYNNLDNIISQPNNILALEYLKVIKEFSLDFEPLPIQRVGAGYHSEQLSELASARAIRNHILKNPNAQLDKSILPASIYSILREELLAGRAPLSISSLEKLILYKIRTSSSNQLKNIYEISEGLENRIWEAAQNSGSYEELVRTVKSKRFSLTRINRILLYILFDITQEEMAAFDKTGSHYINILGFSPKGQKILQEIKSNSNLTIINRSSDFKKILQKKDISSRMLSVDIKASDIYTLSYPNPQERKGRQDFTVPKQRIL